MRKKIIEIILWLLPMLCILYFAYNKEPKTVIKEIHRIDTIYITKHYTDTVPKIVKEYITKIEVDTFIINDSIPIYIDIPISEKVYSNQSDSVSYKAIVSGYKTSLNRIDIDVNYQYYNTTVVKEITKKQRVFNHGVGVMAGYGFINKKPDIFIGYGFHINF